MSHENYDPCFPDQPVVDLYLQIWSKLPSFKSKPVFIWSQDGSTASSSLTYEQLNKSVQCISSNLSHIPLHRGDTVVILCVPGLELVQIIFGCQRAGLTAVSLSPPNPSFEKDSYHHLIRVISQTKPKAAIANHTYIKHVERYLSSSPNNNNHLSECLKKLRWISSEEAARGKELDSGLNPGPYNGSRPDDVYLIQYTSGATGIPKPVLVTAGAAAHNVRAARKAYDLHPNSVIVSWLPQYHDCGLMFLLLTVVSGATCVLTSPTIFVTRPRIWFEMITCFRATCTPVPSFTLPLVLKRGGVGMGTIPINLESMKNLIVINEPIYKASIDEFVNEFRPFGLNPSAIAPSYGLAENCTFVSTSWRSGPETADFPSYNKLLPSARLDSLDKNAEEDIEILIIDEETGEVVEDGTEGEIWISSPSNASGYLGHPSLTREVFNAILKRRFGQCFVRTGDRGVVVGKERYLFVTGRISDIIKLPNGKESHPHYIETAAYNGCPRNLRGGCLAAFMCSRKVTLVAEVQNYGGQRDLREICEGIRKSIMEEENVEIGRVVLVKSGSVPKTTSGKIRRWLAKDDFTRGRMRIIMQMSFKEEDYDLAINKMMDHTSKEEIGTDKRQQGPSFSISHVPLISSL